MSDDEVVDPKLSASAKCLATESCAKLLVGGGALALAGVLAFALHLGWQVAMIDPASTERSLRLFRSNRDAGLILFAGLSLQGLIG